MRIALVTHQFFPRFYTGVERLTLNLAGQLRRMGDECVVVAPAEHSAGRAGAYHVQGTRVVAVDTRPADLARPWLQSRKTRTALRRVVDGEKVELVHVMQPMRLPEAFDEAVDAGLPVVAHLADFTYVCARVIMRRVDGSLCGSAEDGAACARACGIVRASERLEWSRGVLEAAAAVVSPCRFTIRLHGENGFATERWRHIPWGVDYALHPLRLAQPGGRALVIGFLGTLLEHKGAHIAVDAVRSLPGVDVELRLYGSSFHEAAYERELRRRADGDPRIGFLGPYDHEELPAVLAGLDAVVVPSLWHENLPTTALNAVAAGVPLIASDVGGLAEVVHDYACGLLFPAGDARALAELVRSLARDRTRLAGLRSGMAYPPSLEEEAHAVRSVYAEAVGPKLRRR